MPPHIFESIARRGTSEQKAMAETMRASALRIRQQREARVPQSTSLRAPVLRKIDKKKPNRSVHDCWNESVDQEDLPCKLVRGEHDPEVHDQDVNQVYNGAGSTYKLYLEKYHRDSIDGKGSNIVQNVHYDWKYPNAFWNGEQLVYGDGDGDFIVSLTGVTTVAHEFTHGVIQHSGGLAYEHQSGALNESFADIFACLTEQYSLNQNSREATWLVGSDVLGASVKGEAIRSLRAPGTAHDDPVFGKDPQPFHMDNYVVTSEDSGGVHINSGIPNHAFYLLAQYLGGYAWERAGQIWYDTLQENNNPYATFQDWAEKTVEMAIKRYRLGSIEATLTRRAWKLVGICA